MTSSIFESTQSLTEALTTLVDNQAVEYVGGYENQVFRLKTDGKPCILRVTEQRHRTNDAIKAELEFVIHLANQGMSVAAPLRFPSGRQIERLADGESTLWVTIFEEAEGHPLELDDDWENHREDFLRWGAFLGQSHHLSSIYKPPGITRRHHWDDDDLIQIENYLPADDRRLIEACKRVIAEVSELPKTADTFGLIHADLHQGNFFVDDEKITAFDFDDSCYHWYINDLAIALYYLKWPDILSEDILDTPIIQVFLEGYRRHRHFDDRHLEHIPLFFRLRDALLVTSLHKQVGISNLSDDLRLAYHKRRQRLLDSS